LYKKSYRYFKILLGHKKIARISILHRSQGSLGDKAYVDVITL